MVAHILSRTLHRQRFHFRTCCKTLCFLPSVSKKVYFSVRENRIIQLSPNSEKFRQKSMVISVALCYTYNVSLVGAIYRKVHLSVKSLPLQYLGFFVNLRSVSKSSKGHPALFRRRCPCDFTSFPTLVCAVVVLRQGFGWSAEAYPSGLCRRYALGLPLPDIGSLVLCHKGQHLQNNVG